MERPCKGPLDKQEEKNKKTRTETTTSVIILFHTLPQNTPKHTKNTTYFSVVWCIGCKTLLCVSFHGEALSLVSCCMRRVRVRVRVVVCVCVYVLESS